MTSNSKMYGRQYELAWLSSKLFPSKNPHGVPPVVLLNGPSGCGKSFMATALVALHTNDPAKIPLVAFSADVGSANIGVTEFAEALMLTGKATEPALQSEVLKLQGNFKVQVNELKKDRSSSTEAYNLDGSVRTVLLPETAVAGDPEGQELAALSVNSLTELFQRVNAPENALFPQLRLLYIFDNFSNYAPPVKRWIGGPFMEQFSEQSQLPAPSFLLTDVEPWESSGQSDYWQRNPGTFFNHEVPPLERAHCLEWLTNAGHPPTLIDLVMEETEGLPGLIRQLLETPGLLQQKVAELDESKDLPHPVTARERRWLHAAAMADFVSEESLQILLGENEGRDALEWLGSNSCPFDSVDVALMSGLIHVHMRSDLRELVLEQSIAKVPARHKEFLEKVELLAEVTEKVPEHQDRDSLRILSPVQPFNNQILKELFGNHE